MNRPAKRNAFTAALITELSQAYALLEQDDALRAGVLYAHGDHFTAGLDLLDVAPVLAAGGLTYPEGGRSPNSAQQHSPAADLQGVEPSQPSLPEIDRSTSVM